MMNLIYTLVGYIYSPPFMILLFGTSIYFTVRMKFPQFRLLRDMFHLSFDSDDDKAGVSPFQSLMMTVGGRVGIGNIAGVAAAIACGGPGAVFWMWLLALLGASMAFVESTLAQVYKKKIGGQFVGGPAFYIEAGLHNKPLALVSAFCVLFATTISAPGVQLNSICSSVNMMGIPALVTGVAILVVLAIVIFGGIKRIAKVCGVLAPIMAIAYMVVAIIIAVLNITKIPGMLALIVSSAFGTNAVFGGITGAALSYGVQRGLLSNEAGLGSGAAISGSAVSDHPAKQGLIQALSVFIDTIVICTATAIMILTTNSYNVLDSAGNYLVEYLPGVDYGMPYAITAVNQFFSGFGVPFMAFSITLFALTSLLAFYTEAESMIRYLSPGHNNVVYIIRVIFLCGCALGMVDSLSFVWDLADFGNGIAAWVNIISILLLSPIAFKVLKDYDEQRKAGKKPLFDAEKTLGLQGTVWDEIKRKETAEDEK